MKVLFIADPLERLKPQGDTSLYLLRECIRRGASVFWTTSQEISWIRKEVVARTRLILDAGDRQNLPREGAEKELPVPGFDLILLRKEPPFGEDYTRLCWLLAAHEKKGRQCNRASSLLLHHEKMIPLMAVAEGVVKESETIPTCVSDDIKSIRSFADSIQTENIILKPWLGHGGRDVKLLDREDFASDPAIHLGNSEHWMVQPFLEGIFERGDRRVLTLGSKVLGHFVRLPKKGHFVSNLVRGGQAFLRDLEPEEDSILKRLVPWLSSIGIDFAGLDFIDGRLSEVNVTSPTGLGSLEDLTGKNVAPEILDYLLSPAEKEHSAGFWEIYGIR